MKNVLVISNYRAGRKTAIFNKKAVMKFLFKNAENFKIVDIAEADEIDKTQYDTIIAMGGDGTVNKAISYVINTNKMLGIIPCGTANLLAAKLGIPTNVKKALKIIEVGKSSKIDAMTVNDKLSVLRFGLGYDSDIICKTPQSIKNKFGYFSYFVAGILFALRLIPKKYTLTYDDKTIDVDATCIIVANAANMYQNLVSVGNKCKLDDGLLDVWILKTKNPIIFFIEFLSIIFKCRIDSPRALYFKTANIDITNEYSVGHIDGEKEKIRGDISIKTLNKVVNVFS